MYTLCTLERSTHHTYLIFLSGYLSYSENVPHVPPNCNGQVPIPVQWVDQTPTSEKEIISSKDKKRLRKTERKSIKERDEAINNIKKKEENKKKEEKND